MALKPRRYPDKVIISDRLVLPHEINHSSRAIYREPKAGRSSRTEGDVEIKSVVGVSRDRERQVSDVLKRRAVDNLVGSLFKSR